MAGPQGPYTYEFRPMALHRILEKEVALRYPSELKYCFSASHASMLVPSPWQPKKASARPSSLNDLIVCLATKCY